jgi:hypothetical protein
VATAGLVGASTKFTYDRLDKYRIDRELVTWDYVKKHPQDFPEVFNRKYSKFSVNSFAFEFNCLFFILDSTKKVQGHGYAVVD